MSRLKSFSPAAVIGLVLFLVFVVVGILFWFSGRSADPITLRLSTGSKEGTYYSLGVGLAELLEREIEELDAVVDISAGSVENIQRLSDNQADLAFAQNDTLGMAGVRAVASLYEEVLHVLVRADLADEIGTVEDLGGRRVALGAAESGTEAVSRRVLKHFGFEEVDGLPQGNRQIQTVQFGSEQALAELRSGGIDAAFVLSAFKSTRVEEACANNVARLLTIGVGAAEDSAAAGIAAAFPFYQSITIPEHTYGAFPETAIRTISVRALLVVRDDLEADLVQRIAEILYAGRSALAEKQAVALRFREEYDPAAVQFPFHDGAIDYYNREQPPFLVEYAEAISLTMTIGAALLSFALMMRETLKRTKKDRIDVYYAKLIEISERIQEGVDPRVLRRSLNDIRREAFRELMSERIKANDSFIIFQDYLRELHTEVDVLEKTQAR